MRSSAAARSRGRVSGITSESAQEAGFKLFIELPKDIGRTLKYRPVVGYVDGSPEDTVTCAEDVQDSHDDGDTVFVCVDDPETPEELRKSLKIELD